MKVKVLDRDASVCGNAEQLIRLFKNPDPKLHPFRREREYMRSLVAVKMDKIFAKPFIAAMEGHTDGVKCLVRGNNNTTSLYSSSLNGEICVWNLAQKKYTCIIRGHDEGFVRGLCINSNDSHLISGGHDKKIKMWKLKKDRGLNFLDSALYMSEEANAGLMEELGCEQKLNPNSAGISDTPVKIFDTSSPVSCLDHHRSKPLFVACGESVDIWDEHRSSPLHKFQWGSEVAYCGRFNPAEHSLIAAGLGDNSVTLYDIRGNTPIRKTLMKMRTNSVSWNPMEPLNFTVANEDQNLYTFDMRQLNKALRVHKDFVNAVLSVDYSPTGKEFVAGSFDATVRIFKTDEGRSRDVYHTKRMQSVLSCVFSGDATFVLSGSADMCVRLWKADSSAQLGPRNYQERRACAYRHALKKQFGHLPEIKRIARHHHVPRLIKKTTEKKRIMVDAKKDREYNKLMHSASGAAGAVALSEEKSKSIYKEIE